MIELKECTDKCFLEVAGQCKLLTEMPEECNYTCPWYKPKGCKDWIRIEEHGEAMICTPEENERRFKSETSTEANAVYWRIKILPSSKRRFWKARIYS